MNNLPLHPMIVHLPIALAVLMPLISAGLLLAWTRDLLPRRTWFVAVALQALLVASGFVAMRTGGAEEERVEKIVGESAIETHEEAAEVFTWGAAGALVFFVAGALIPAAGAARGAATAATAATLVVLFLGYRVGEAGAVLVYQHGAASAYTNGTGAGGEGGGEAGGGATGGDDADDADEN